MHTSNHERYSRGGLRMNRRIGRTTRHALLLMGLLMGLAASTAHAQMCGGGSMESQAGASMQAPGQMPMMGMMGMMSGTASRMGGPMDPMGMMGMKGEGQMDPKTRGQMLQMRGEMLKAMGDIMIKHGQALGQTQLADVGRAACRRLGASGLLFGRRHAAKGG
jgi:hypothetical protein